VAFSGEIEGWATRSALTVETRRVVSPSEALGAVDATDPLAEIEVSSATWASSVWCRSNSIRER